MTRRQLLRALLIPIGAFALIMVVWQVPALNPVLYPFRLFVTTVHELGHGTAALISGGQFRGYEVFANGTGLATTAGGTPGLVISAGYVGTALFGAALLFLANRTSLGRAIAFVLGIAFLLMTVLFARSFTAIAAGAISGVVLLLLGWKTNGLLIGFVLNTLAFATGLNALLDLWGLLDSMDSSVVLRLGNIPNDAYNMSLIVGTLPPVVWAVLWMLFAVLLLGISAYFTFWRPLRNSRNRALNEGG